jgi:cytochrome b subunit of formate dehydrogenase
MTDVQRFGRAARCFHTFVYLTVLVALVTGWWFVVDRYQHPLGPDTTIHELAGVLLILGAVVYVVARARAAWAFVKESATYERGDLRWLLAWPRAALTGRFPHHDGQYDPGQRLASAIMMATLTAIALSGIAMLTLPSEALPVSPLQVHRWATFLFTPVVVGHMIVAAGVLPGYRGVWRSIHRGGRLPRDVSARIWPGWTGKYASGRQ